MNTYKLLTVYKNKCRDTVINNLNLDQVFSKLRIQKRQATTINPVIAVVVEPNITDTTIIKEELEQIMYFIKSEFDFNNNEIYKETNKPKIH